MYLLAYVDPGSGLMLVQIVSAGCLGFVLSLRKVRDRIKRAFSRKG